MNARDFEKKSIEQGEGDKIQAEKNVESSDERLRQWEVREGDGDNKAVKKQVSGSDWYSEDDSDDTQQRSIKKQGTVRVKEVGLDLGEKEDRELKVTQIKSELKEHIGSEAYLDKLILENDGDKQKAQDNQQKRLQALEVTQVYPNEKRGSDMVNNILENLVKSNDQFKDLPSERQNGFIKFLQKQYNDPNAGGFYDSTSGRTVIFDDVKGDQFTNAVRHELLHGSTNMQEHISQNVKALLDSTFRSYHDVRDPRVHTRGAIKKADTYLKEYSERLVRKQQLDDQLEKLGIRNYGDEFTRGQYEKMMEAYEQKKFSEDVDQLINTTEPDFDVYKDIFDTIADIETQKNDTEMAV